MSTFDFSLIIASHNMSDEQILDATDALGDAGCTDGSLSGHPDGMEVHFARSGRAMQSAIALAIKVVESAGFRVLRVEMEREAIVT